jgi:hypothetical protein
MASGATASGRFIVGETQREVEVKRILSKQCTVQKAASDLYNNCLKLKNFPTDFETRLNDLLDNGLKMVETTHEKVGKLKEQIEIHNVQLDSDIHVKLNLAQLDTDPNSNLAHKDRLKNEIRWAKLSMKSESGDAGVQYYMTMKLLEGIRSLLGEIVKTEREVMAIEGVVLDKCPNLYEPVEGVRGVVFPLKCR